MILAFRMEVMSKSSPPVEDALQGQRIQRMKEKIAQKAFIEVILQILFAIIVFSISYVNRDERAFRLKNNIDNFLYRSTKTQFGFSKVSWKHLIISNDMSIYTNKTPSYISLKHISMAEVPKGKMALPDFLNLKTAVTNPH